MRKAHKLSNVPLSHPVNALSSDCVPRCDRDGQRPSQFDHDFFFILVVHQRAILELPLGCAENLFFLFSFLRSGIDLAEVGARGGSWAVVVGWGSVCPLTAVPVWA